MGDEQHCGSMKKTRSVEEKHGDCMRTYTLIDTRQETHPYYKFTDLSSRYCPFKEKKVFDMSQSVLVHLQLDGVKTVHFKDTEYRVLTASTQNCWCQPKYAFVNLWFIWSCIIQTHRHSKWQRKTR